MKIKRGCNLKYMHPEIAYAMGVARSLYIKYGYELVVTSGNDSIHSKNSLHYQNKAIDLRTKNISVKGKEDLIITDLKFILEKEGFDVILETDHIHIEYDPKQGEQLYSEVD